MRRFGAGEVHGKGSANQGANGGRFMRAMILAAGLGTRLLPLTRLRPKCLMPVMNQPLLGLWLKRLQEAGAQRVVVNTHHLAGQVREYLEQAAPSDLEVRISHEPEILGTGGGLVAARGLLGEGPFLLANADVVSSADLRALSQTLEASQATACLGLVDDPRFNTVAVGSGGRVLGFRGDPGLGPVEGWLTYSGLAAMCPALWDHLPAQGYGSLVPGLRAAMAAGELVQGVNLDAFWDDLGSPAALLGLHQRLASDPPAGLEHLAPSGPVALGPDAVVQPGAALSGVVVLGQGCLVEAGAQVADSLLLPGARVGAGARVSNAVLGDGFVAHGVITGGAHA